MQTSWHVASDVRRALLAVLIARTVVNGGLRVVYPFVPAIARGLGVSVAAIAVLLAVRSFAGLSAPVVARFAETHGRRALMLAAVGVVLVGNALVALAPGYAAAAAGFLLVGVAKPAFDVPMQAWFADRVPYERRGRVLGATELTWALSLLATVPLSGVLIARVGWRAPFVLLAVLALVGAGAVRALIASDRPTHPRRRPLRLDGARLRVLAAVLLFTVASEILFVMYGVWLEDAFGLTVTAIGFFTLLVGLSELAGEGAVTALADRVGLRRAVLAGLVVSALAYGALGFVGASLSAAVLVVVGWFVGFEVTIVSTVPLVSELAAESRERLLALMVAVIAGARAVGALVAPHLYDVGGIGANGAVAAVLVLVAAVLLAAGDASGRARRQD